MKRRGADLSRVRDDAPGLSAATWLPLCWRSSPSRPSSGGASYSEKCVEFLLGVKSLVPFRLLWCIAVPLGATADLGFVWLLADTLNALMAVPNLIALGLLSPLVFKLTRDFFANGRVESPSAV